MHITQEGQALKSGLNIGWSIGSGKNWWKWYVRFIHVSIDMKDYSCKKVYIRLCTYRSSIFQISNEVDLIKNHLLCRGQYIVTREFLEDMYQYSVDDDGEVIDNPIYHTIFNLFKAHKVPH